MFKSDLKFVGMAEANEFPPKITVRFTCPKCGGHTLNLESPDVLGCQAVEGIDEEKNLVLGRPTFFTEESSFYLCCPDCGYEPAVDLQERGLEKAIIELLNKNFQEDRFEASMENVEREKQ